MSSITAEEGYESYSDDEELELGQQETFLEWIGSTIAEKKPLVRAMVSTPLRWGKSLVPSLARGAFHAGVAVTVVVLPFVVLSLSRSAKLELMSAAVAVSDTKAGPPSGAQSGGLDIDQPKQSGIPQF
jgi:hypothetical protein